MGKLPDSINLEWHFTDVQDVRPDLTNDQAREVLQAVKHNEDANLGVTWETISIFAESLFPLPNPNLPYETTQNSHKWRSRDRFAFMPCKTQRRLQTKRR